jgi:hypothetical protein
MPVPGPGERTGWAGTGALPGLFHLCGKRFGRERPGWSGRREKLIPGCHSGTRFGRERLWWGTRPLQPPWIGPGGTIGGFFSGGRGAFGGPTKRNRRLLPAQGALGQPALGTVRHAQPPLTTWAPKFNGHTAEPLKSNSFGEAAIQNTARTAGLARERGRRWLIGLID